MRYILAVIIVSLPLMRINAGFYYWSWSWSPPPAPLAGPQGVLGQPRDLVPPDLLQVPPGSTLLYVFSSDQRCETGSGLLDTGPLTHNNPPPPPPHSRLHANISRLDAALLIIAGRGSGGGWGGRGAGGEVIMLNCFCNSNVQSNKVNDVDTEGGGGAVLKCRCGPCDVWGGEGGVNLATAALTKCSFHSVKPGASWDIKSTGGWVCWCCGPLVADPGTAPPPPPLWDLSFNCVTRK